MKNFIILLLGIFTLTYSCQKSSCPDAVKAKFLDATGTDGCGMLIELTNGQKLEPRNLDDFDIEPKDGEKIWVSYHLAESGGTIYMVGKVVFINCISKR